VTSGLETNMPRGLVIGQVDRVDSEPNNFIELSLGKPGVLRGGSWYGYAAYGRVSNRRSSSLEYIFSDIGFRVVVSER